MNPNAMRSINIRSDQLAFSSFVPRAAAPAFDRPTVCCATHAAGVQTPDGRWWCWSQSVAPRAYPDPEDGAVVANIRATLKRWRADMRQQFRSRT
jgi:hypothetical protein